MGRQKLAFADHLTLPIDAVTQTFAFLARRGAGKTYAAMKLAELMLDVGAQIVAIDPVGVWYGLRLAADGKGRGLDIPVLGGLHGDLPLEPGAGALIADLVVDKGISVILDVSLFRKNERKQFVTAFCEQLFYRKKQQRSALHVFFEEAHVFIPQKAFRGDERMAGAVQDLSKLGRNFGIGVTLIGQRPQAIDKDVLNQTECLCVGQMNGPQERKTIGGWIVEKGISGLGAGLIDDLPVLRVGHMICWSPQWLQFNGKIVIAERWTYDASATPVVGRRMKRRTLAPVDLQKLSAAMKDVVERAAQEDPKALQAKIAELQQQIRKGELTVTARKVEQPQPKSIGPKGVVYRDRLVPVLPPLLERRLRRTMSHVNLLSAQLTRALVQVEKRIAKSLNVTPPGNVTVTAPPTQHRLLPVSPRTPAQPAPSGSNGSVHLKAGARRLLQVVAQRHPIKMTRAQAGTLAGFTPSGGTFNQYLRTLKSEGFVAEEGDDIVISQRGFDYLGDDVPCQPTTTEEIQEMWRSRMKKGEREMLDFLIRVYPRAVDRAEIGEETGFETSGGTFNQYLRTLKRNGLAEERDGQVRASPTLYAEDASL